MISLFIALAVTAQPASTKITVRVNGALAPTVQVFVSKKNDFTDPSNFIELEDPITNDIGEVNTARIPTDGGTRYYLAHLKGVSSLPVPRAGRPMLVELSIDVADPASILGTDRIGWKCARVQEPYQDCVTVSKLCMEQGPDGVFRPVPNSDCGKENRCETKSRLVWRFVPRKYQWFFYQHTGQWKMHEVERYVRPQIGFGPQPSPCNSFRPHP